MSERRKSQHTCISLTSSMSVKVSIHDFFKKLHRFITYFCFIDDPPEGLVLEDILSFFTGAEVIPPLGFDHTPALYFNSEALFPTASTCALELCLPTRYHSSYAMFKQKASLAFKCHGGFGLR